MATADSARPKRWVSCGRQGALALMDFHVVLMVRANNEVLRSVISRISVNVVNLGSLRKRPAKREFCDFDMQIPRASVDGAERVSTGGNVQGMSSCWRDRRSAPHKHAIVVLAIPARDDLLAASIDGTCALHRYPFNKNVRVGSPVTANRE
jgi:hypothetical protein